MSGDKNPNNQPARDSGRKANVYIDAGKRHSIFARKADLCGLISKPYKACKRSLLLGSSFFALPNFAYSQGWSEQIKAIDLFNPSSAALFALFGGALSFSILSAFWLIKEKNKANNDNAALRKRYAIHKAERDRMEALVNVDDQCTLIWNGADSVETIGSLGKHVNAPSDARSFSAFGKWLSATSAMEIEPVVSRLQENGEAFDMIVETNSGAYIEAQGRTSGSFPFVRFRELDKKRSDFANLTIEYNRLTDKFNLIEKLLNGLPFPFWMRNKDGALHWVNQSYVEAVEAKDGEAAVSENRQLFDQNEFEQIVGEQKSNSFFTGFLPAIVSGDHKKLQTFDILTDSGNAGIAIDRSDVEAARTALKETIVSHEQTIDNLGTAIAIFDSKKNLSFANSSFQNLWDLEQSFLDENPSNDQILDAMKDSGRLSEIPDWKKWKAQQLEIYQSTETIDEQWHLPNGQTLRVIIHPQSQGGASWAFENVTEELELRSSYNALMRVQGETLDHLNEAVAVFGSDGKVRLTNPTFLNMWQFEDAYALDGKHINSFSENCTSLLLNKDEWENIRIGITGVSDSRDDLSGQIELLSGNIFDYRLVRLPDAQTMLTMVDMTAAVNVERALKERNDALEESDGLKTKFIQHVSYELRAPLTSIAGFAEILTSNVTGKLNDKQAEYLDYISQSSDVLKALIDDILDLATIDAGVMQLDLQNITLEDIISQALAAVDDKIQRHQLKVEINVDANANKLIADPDRLQQILYNLISNAVNASPDGTQITISSSQVKDMIEFCVADQGSGVADEFKHKVFERFEGGRAPDKRKGAGLGLSIVKSFVELHGGEVLVEDAKDRGAMFICRMPVEPEVSLAAAE